MVVGVAAAADGDDVGDGNGGGGGDGGSFLSMSSTLLPSYSVTLLPGDALIIRFLKRRTAAGEGKEVVGGRRMERH